MAIPMYLCNSMALVFGGGRPIDLGKNMPDRKRIFGDGKTVKGAVAGIAIATLAAFVLSLVFPETSIFIKADYTTYGFLLAIGTIAGDMTASFAKRRTCIERGRSVLFLDQLDFLVGGFIVGALLVTPTALEVVFLLAFTMLAHGLGNRLAFEAKIKKVPW